ncbi:MAG: phospholipid carrier-dependent glycosyltransferase [Anaerolineaceae bacterium]
MKSKEKIIISGVLLIAIMAAIQVIYTTRWGLVAGSDSAVYLAAARNLLKGDGLQILLPSGNPATLMPPLYSLALSALGGLNLDILQAARWLNAVLFLITILFSGLVVVFFCRSSWLALPASLIIALYPIILYQYSSMMTEPLFLAFVMICMFLFLQYLEIGKSKWIIAAGLITGLLTLTRFIGYVLFPVGIIITFLNIRVGLKRRLVDILSFVMAYSIPVLIWLVWFHYNPDASPMLGRPLWTNPWEYLAPVRSGMVSVLWNGLPFSDQLPIKAKLLRFDILIGLAMIWSCATLWSAIRLFGKRLSVWVTDRDMRLIILSGLFFLCYVFGFIFVYLFRLPTQDVNARTLLPLFPTIILMLIGSLSLYFRSAKGMGRKLIYMFSAFLLIGICSGYLKDNIPLMKNLHDNGGGYSSPVWQYSKTIQNLSQISPEMKIISNDTGAVLFFTNRSALEFKQSFDKLSTTEFTRYGNETLDDAQQLFHDRQAVLVLFTPSLFWQLEPVFQDQTQERINLLLGGLEKVSETSDGGIYLYPIQP